MEVLSEVLAKLDMETNYVSQKPEPNRIMKNIIDLEPIFRSTQEYMNRFSKEVNEDVFFNIETVKSSKQEISEFLLNVDKIGQKTNVILYL